MKTTILLILSAAILSRAADPQKAADSWQQSLTAESNQDYPTAIQLTADFKSAGGGTYLATIRTAWLSYLAKDYDKAVQFYTAAAKADSHALTPHLGLMYTYKAQNKPDDALRASKAALTLDPSNREVLLLAGELLFNQGDFRQAERLFAKASDLKPEDPIALSWLGWSRIGQGQMKQAAAQFETLKQINPSGYLVEEGYIISHSPPPGPPGGPPPPRR